MKLFDIRKTKEQETNETTICDSLNDDGNWCANGGNLACWDNKVELELHTNYKHRYVLVWNNDAGKPKLRRIKK